MSFMFKFILFCSENFIWQPIQLVFFLEVIFKFFLHFGTFMANKFNNAAKN